jgi:hypothetical protein
MQLAGPTAMWHMRLLNLPGQSLFSTLMASALTLCSLSVPQQALLDVSSALNPALGYGANGIAGLGFTSLSTIDALVNASSESTGRSLLYNLFAVNPSEPNFLAFALQRSTEAGDEVVGSFSIGWYQPSFTNRRLICRR